MSEISSQTHVRMSHADSRQNCSPCYVVALGGRFERNNWEQVSVSFIAFVPASQKLQTGLGPTLQDTGKMQGESPEGAFLKAIKHAQAEAVRRDGDVLMEAHLGYKLRNGKWLDVPPELKIFWWKGLPLLATFPPISLARGIVWRRDFSGVREPDPFSSPELRAGLLEALHHAGVDFGADEDLGVGGLTGFQSHRKYDPWVWERLDIRDADEEEPQKSQFHDMVRGLCTEIAPAFVRAVFEHTRMKDAGKGVREDLHTLIMGRTDFLLGRQDVGGPIVPYFGEIQNLSGAMPGDGFLREDGTGRMKYDGFFAIINASFYGASLTTNPP